MLEEDVVLVCRAADAPEDVTLHEVVHIRPEAINNLVTEFKSGISPKRPDILLGNVGVFGPTNVVVVPDIQLRNLAVRDRERRSIVPVVANHGAC